MKKTLIYGLSLALVLSLTACRRPEPAQPAEPQEPAQDTQQTEPVTTEPAPPPEQLSSQEKPELSEDALIRYFQLTYDSCKAADSSSPEEQISFELEMLQSFCDTDGEKLPADYEAQYRAWRPAEQQTPAEQPPRKPSTGNAQQGGGATQNTPQPGGQSQDTYNPDDLWTDPYAGMTPEEKAAQIEADRQATQEIVDGITGTLG